MGWQWASSNITASSFFFWKQSNHFIAFSRVHLSPELPKKLQTLGGDQSKHRIDPGPNSSQHEQVYTTITRAWPVLLLNRQCYFE
jgi:hypothetical protein